MPANAPSKGSLADSASRRRRRGACDGASGAASPRRSTNCTWADHTGGDRGEELPSRIKIHALGAPGCAPGPSAAPAGSPPEARSDSLRNGFHLNFLVLLLRPFFPRGTRVLVRQNGTVSAILAFGGLPWYTRRSTGCSTAARTGDLSDARRWPRILPGDLGIPETGSRCCPTRWMWRRFALPSACIRPQNRPRPRICWSWEGSLRKRASICCCAPWLRSGTTFPRQSADCRRGSGRSCAEGRAPCELGLDDPVRFAGSHRPSLVPLSGGNALCAALPP
jgi:hypothetical protein